MTGRGPSAAWGPVAALGLASAGCQTFATVAIVDAPDGSPATVDGAGPPDAVDGAAGGDALATMGADAASPSPDGSLACGAWSCDLSSQICCTCPSCALPFPTECFPTFPGCEPATVYSALACASSSNCPEQISCCASFSDTGLTGASCRRACSSGDTQLCASSAECPAGKTCQPLTSIPGFSGCG